jgi:heme A synthase
MNQRLQRLPARQKVFAFSIFVLAFIVFVIVWGAYVRATGSGAGCGSHWPLCNGVAIPRAPSLQTQIEYFHRVTSGLSLLFVVGLSTLIFKNFSKGLFIRKAAATATISILMEALIGAGLVLLELVSHNQSVKRTISISLHFVNTLILLGALSLIIASFLRAGRGWTWTLRPLRRQALFFTSCFFLIGMTGAITALGDTLFPAQSLLQGLQQDWESSSHYLVKLRFIHPTLAVAFALLSTPWINSQSALSGSSITRKVGRLLILFIFLNLGLGLTNLVLLAPISLQLIHLTVALCVWITWVMWIDQIATSSETH